MFRLQLSAVLFFSPTAVFCGFPAIAQITPASDGTGTVVNTTGNVLSITGGSLSSNNQNLFHNFADFNVSTGQTADFLGNPTLQNILSRVSGGNPSFIDGLISVSNSDANLFLINSSGLVFGENAGLNVTGDFTASTATGIGFDGEFWTNGADYSLFNGNPTNFIFDGTSAIINAGDLNVAAGQALNFFASNVVNTGNLAAPQGKIQAIAVPGSNTLRLSQDGQILSLEISPTTNLTATNLPELLTGSGLDSLITSPNLDATSGGTLITGNLDTTGVTGGNIGIFGRNIFLESANLNTSGPNGGGNIFVGGDYQGLGTLPTAFNTFVDANSSLNSSALSQGNAGQTIVWADNATGFYGSAIATGGLLSGDGGLVETSGKNYLDVFGAIVDASAVNGVAGEWLLDPTDVFIEFGGPPSSLVGGVFDPATSPSSISPLTILTAINGGTNVTITTSSGTGGLGDIEIRDPIDQLGTSTASLTFTSRRFTSIPDAINLSSTGDLIFNINSVNPGTATAAELGASLQAAQDAIGFIGDPDPTINLAAGTYSLAAGFTLNENITINGAGETLTFLDDGDATLGSGANHIITTTLGVSPVIINIRDLTIQNGGTAGSIGGGGIFNTLNTLNLDEVTITNNTARAGGGLYNEGGTVTITNSLFANNETSGVALPNGGGAIANNSQSVLVIIPGNITIDSTTIRDNTSVSIAGGVLNNSGTLTIRNSTISGNTAVQGGGGIENYSGAGNFSLENSLVTGNSVSAGDGGGIKLTTGGTGTATITNSLITGNRAEAGTNNGGGGIFNQDATTITRTTIAGNTTDDDGGGVFNSDAASADLTLIDSTVSGNTADDDGGGIFNFGDLTVERSTISGNGASGFGGGLFNRSLSPTSFGSITLQDSIIADSTVGDDFVNEASAIAASLTTLGITLVEDGSLSDPNVISGDPDLRPLGDYGGFDIGDPNTGTTPLTTHLPNIGSPVIDEGSTTASTTSDERGGTRIVNGRVDLGAVEFQGIELDVVSGDGQSTDVNTDFSDVIIEATEITFGNLLENVVVDFSTPAAGASATPAPTSGTTDATGRTSTTLTANSEIGSFTLDATTATFAVNTATSATLTNTPGPVIVPDPVPDPTPDPDPIPDPEDSGDGDFPDTPDIPDTPEEMTETPEAIASFTDECAGVTACQEEPESGLSSLENTEALTENQGNLTVITAQLEKIREETGVNPALIYAFFSPPEQDGLIANKSEEDKAETDGEGLTQWSYRGDRLTDFLNADARFLNPPEKLDNDGELELVMVTYSGKVIRQKVPGITRADVMPQARDFMNGVTRPQLGRRYLAPAQYLYDVFLRPLVPDIKEEDINNLTFIMDEGFRALPIAALHDGDRFIIEDYSVGLMPSFSLTNTSGYVPPRNNQLLAMGASEFQELADLPAAALEAQVIADTIWQGDVFVNQQFTVDNLLAARERNPYGIVHLATHGEFRSGENGESFIQFQDQRVSIAELSRLQLNSPPIELLVLSACRTALGDRQAELGFAGLALAAGAKSAIGSLWYVSDQGTLALMTGLYEALQDAPIKAEALRQAQLDLLKRRVYVDNNQLITPDMAIALPPALQNSRSLDFSHPYFWSGFALVGNPW